MVKVAIGKRLDFQEGRLAQVARHALASLDGEIVVADGQDRTQHRQPQHQRRGLQHHGSAMLGNALIDNALDEARDRQVDEHNQRQQNKADD